MKKFLLVFSLILCGLSSWAEGVTDMPFISFELYDTECMIYAVGEGYVCLYVDNVEVDNPYYVTRTHEQQVIHCSATAQLDGCAMSDVATLDVVVPPIEGSGQVPGDVTGDGVVDVSDMNAVINVILGTQENAAADVTGDGVIDIQDMNQVINIMLGAD